MHEERGAAGATTPTRGGDAGRPLRARAWRRWTGASLRNRLPFNEVDEVIHHLDTRQEPWSVHVEARVAGRIDEARLRSAVACEGRLFLSFRHRTALWDDTAARRFADGFEQELRLALGATS
ncbi:MAG TPA: hypothetical protein VMW35_14320 [Myxococcota bacterium]|nr:hypothetical protein [Myxococcota bacterium]